MTRVDDRILELLASADIAANPATIAYNIDYDNSYVGHRCRILAQGGLLERVDEPKSMYRITERGRAYLRGDLDADDLPTEVSLDEGDTGRE